MTFVSMPKTFPIEKLFVHIDMVETHMSLIKVHPHIAQEMAKFFHWNNPFTRQVLVAKNKIGHKAIVILPKLPTKLKKSPAQFI